MENGKTCPRCGGPVKSGRLSSHREIHWISDERERQSLWEKLRHPGGDLQLPMPGAPEGWTSPLGEITAYHCPVCTLFFFDGREEPIK